MSYGGGTVTITGTGFSTPDNMSCSFGDFSGPYGFYWAAGYTYISSTQIVVGVPADIYNYGRQQMYLNNLWSASTEVPWFYWVEPTPMLLALV
jgi:hypothetical protein